MSASVRKACSSKVLSAALIIRAILAGTSGPKEFFSGSAMIVVCHRNWAGCGGLTCNGRSPSSDVTLADGYSEQLRKLVRGARKGRHSKRCQRRRMFMVVGRRSRIRQGKQGDHRYPSPQQGGDPAQHLLGDTAFVEIGDQHQNRLGRSGDQPLAVSKCPVDVGAATELATKQDIDRIGQLVSKIGDFGVEGHYR